MPTCMSDEGSVTSPPANKVDRTSSPTLMPLPMVNRLETVRCVSLLEVNVFRVRLFAKQFRTNMTESVTSLCMPPEASTPKALELSAPKQVEGEKQVNASH